MKTDRKKRLYKMADDIQRYCTNQDDCTEKCIFYRDGCVLFEDTPDCWRLYCDVFYVEDEINKRLYKMADDIQCYCLDHEECSEKCAFYRDRCVLYDSTPDCWPLYYDFFYGEEEGETND